MGPGMRPGFGPMGPGGPMGGMIGPGGNMGGNNMGGSPGGAMPPSSMGGGGPGSGGDCGMLTPPTSDSGSNNGGPQTFATVKASAPNTIQYLPSRPNLNDARPRGPPSLDFLQRFANPDGKNVGPNGSAGVMSPDGQMMPNGPGGPMGPQRMMGPGKYGFEYPYLNSIMNIFSFYNYH